MQTSAKNLIAELLADRTSSEELLQKFADRARAVWHLNAFINFGVHDDVENARRIDELRRDDAGRAGRLAGLPILVKDNIDVAGWPTTAGTPGLEKHIPRHDAPIIRRLRREGAVIAAKTNMHELAFGMTSKNVTYGTVLNPLDQNYTAGGSSGGTAAAIAAGVLPAGLGTDTSGSVRAPAAACGIVGFRPSFGRYPAGGIVPLSHNRDVIGVLGRTISDVETLDQAITGTRERASDIRHLRIGIPRRYFCEDLSEEVEEGFEAALERISSAGVTLVDVDISANGPLTLSVLRPVIRVDMPGDFASYLAASGSSLTLEDVFAAVADADVREKMAPMFDIDIDALRIHHDALSNGTPKIVSNFRAAFQTHQLDALAYPTSPILAPPVAEEGTIEIRGTAQSTLRLCLRNTLQAAIIGAPSIVLPIPGSSQPLCPSLMLECLPGDDNRLLDIAGHLETLLGTA